MTIANQHYRIPDRKIIITNLEESLNLFGLSIDKKVTVSHNYPRYSFAEIKNHLSMQYRKEINPFNYIIGIFNKPRDLTAYSSYLDLSNLVNTPVATDNLFTLVKDTDYVTEQDPNGAQLKVDLTSLLLANTGSIEFIFIEQNIVLTNTHVQNLATHKATIIAATKFYRTKVIIKQ